MESRRRGLRRRCAQRAGAGDAYDDALVGPEVEDDEDEDATGGRPDMVVGSREVRMTTMRKQEEAGSDLVARGVSRLNVH